MSQWQTWKRDVDHSTWKLCRRSLHDVHPEGILFTFLGLCMSLLNCSLTLLLLSFQVPIIPSFLFATYKNASPSAVLQSRVPTVVSTAVSYNTIFSYYNNTRVVISDYTATMDSNSTSKTQGGNASHLPKNPLISGDNCTEGAAFLTKENVRVGLLFASKALVQLVANPFVGPLTNR